MSRNETDIRNAAAVLTPPPRASEEQLPLFSDDALRAVQKKEDAWRRESTRKPFWKKDFTTVSSMEVNPLGTPLSVADLDFNEVAYPGEFPYTRGIHPSGYRGRLWTMRQFAGYGSAKQTNERFKYLLSHG